MTRSQPSRRYFSLFATTAKDLVSGQIWESWLTGELPTASSTVEDPFTPAKRIADGSIVLLNAAAPFDSGQSDVSKPVPSSMSSDMRRATRFWLDDLGTLT